MYAMLNRKAAIYVGNIIGLAMDLLMVNGILMNAGWTLSRGTQIAENAL
jgi:hypothetical protein